MGADLYLFCHSSSCDAGAHTHVVTMTMASLTAGTVVFARSSQYVGAERVVFGMVLAFSRAANDICTMCLTFLSADLVIFAIRLAYLSEDAGKP